MKIWFGLAVGMLIVLAAALVVLAWIKGGLQEPQTVEIPVNPATSRPGGA